MKKAAVLTLLVSLSLWLAGGLSPGRAAAQEEPAAPKARVVITGEVKDSHHEPVRDAEIGVLINGQEWVEKAGRSEAKPRVTSSDGGFAISLELPDEVVRTAKFGLNVIKTSYRNIMGLDLGAATYLKHEGSMPVYIAHSEISFVREIGPAFWIAVLVLAGIYVLISFELFHRTLAALFGAALVLLISYTAGQFDPEYFIISYEGAMGAIDWNVIFLLFGMMIIVGILKETGLFQWLAYKSFRLAGGRVYPLAIILMIVTAVASAFLDNVTTMLLLCPVTIEICLILKLHPFALLIPETLASNFGGTATLIGDPPNIMIGSYAGLTFNDFVIALTPVVILVMIMQVIITKFYYGKQYAAAEIKGGAEPARAYKGLGAGSQTAPAVQTREARLEQMYMEMRAKYAITDAKLLKFGLGVLGFVIFLFIMHGALHMEVSIAALMGAALLLVLSKVDIVHVLEKEIEWPTLVFFMMLFVIVGAAEEVGLLQIIADWIAKTSAGNLVVAILIIAWVSAFMSAFIDNIPFTATMLPIVAYLTKTIPGAEDMILWWALSLGACFGGNGTVIGASANVVTAGLMEKAGYPVSFGYFMKVGMPVMILSMVIASFWLVFFMR
jgi:Na+/H+ antiporter NhaD/arsenite permease-like protein